MLKEDPPATYVRKPSFHEADFNPSKKEKSAEIGIKKDENHFTAQTDPWCDSVGEHFCYPSGVLEQVLGFGSLKGDERKAITELSSPSSQDHSESSAEDRSFSANYSTSWTPSCEEDFDSNGQKKQQRGRFLVWPAKH